MTDGTKDTALGLGERLRSTRKARALTLEQAAFSIRLEASVLRALEDERYEELGAAVFVRGHLKAYAKLLGLSEESVLAAYRAADPNADAPAKVTRELERPLTTTPGPIAIAVAVIIAIILMLLLFSLSGGKEPGRVSAPAARPASAVVTLAPAQDATPSVPAAPDSPATVEPGPSPAVLPDSVPGPETPQGPPEGATETVTPAAEVTPTAGFE